MNLNLLQLSYKMDPPNLPPFNSPATLKHPSLASYFHQQCSKSYSLTMNESSSWSPYLVWSWRQRWCTRPFSPEALVGMSRKNWDMARLLFAWSPLSPFSLCLSLTWVLYQCVSPCHIKFCPHFVKFLYVVMHAFGRHTCSIRSISIFVRFCSEFTVVNGGFQDANGGGYDQYSANR